MHGIMGAAREATSSGTETRMSRCTETDRLRDVSDGDSAEDFETPGGLSDSTVEDVELEGASNVVRYRVAVSRRLFALNLCLRTRPGGTAMSAKERL